MSVDMHLLQVKESFLIDSLQQTGVYIQGTYVNE